MVFRSKATGSNRTHANKMQLLRGDLLSYFITTDAKGSPELEQSRSEGFLLYASVFRAVGVKEARGALESLKGTRTQALLA